MRCSWMLVALLWSATPAMAQTEIKLVASDGAAGDVFGWAVAIDRGTAVIGARRADSFRGAAYIFTRAADGTWSEQIKLVPVDSAANAELGSSVAISGDTVVVGGEETAGLAGPGAAFVYTRDVSGAWTEQAKLVASDGLAHDRFGRSVAVDRDRIVVGADGVDSSRGAAYVFVPDPTRSAWVEQARLNASDGVADDGLGYSTAISGDTVVVGASAADAWTGAAYVFQRVLGGFWIEKAKLVASDGAPEDFFGRSVSIDGDVIVVGAYCKAGFVGAAYVFTRDSTGSWSEHCKLVASDASPSALFGSSAHIDRDTIVIGAYGDSSTQGAAYVFARDAAGAWTEQLKLTASDAAAGDAFGASVSVSGDAVLSGALNSVSGGASTGAAYVLTSPLIGPFFADGFESGDTTGWSAAVQ